jgi:hypothetical protein
VRGRNRTGNRDRARHAISPTSFQDPAIIPGVFRSGQPYYFAAGPFESEHHASAWAHLQCGIQPDISYDAYSVCTMQIVRPVSLRYHQSGGQYPRAPDIKTAPAFGHTKPVDKVKYDKTTTRAVFEYHQACGIVSAVQQDVYFSMGDNRNTKRVVPGLTSEP